MASFYRIESAKDLPEAIKFASGDGAGAKFRWYVARMAKAYGKTDLVPKDWDVDTSSAAFRVRSEAELQQNGRVDQAVDALADTAGKVVDGEVEAEQAATEAGAIMASASRAGVGDEVERAWHEGLDVLVADGSLTDEQREVLVASVAGKVKRAASKVRKVRTMAGVRRYGAPIGTPIVADPKTGKLKADITRIPKGAGKKIKDAEGLKEALDADRAKIAEIRKSDRAVASDGETLREVQNRIEDNKKALDSALADGDGDVRSSRIAKGARVERTPIEDLEEGDELQYKTGDGATSRVVEKVTPRKDGGYDLIVSDSEGRETSHTIPKGSQLRKVYDEGEEPEYLSRGTVKDRLDRDLAGIKAEKQRFKAEGADPKDRHISKDALVDSWLAGLSPNYSTHKDPGKWKAPKGTNLDDKTPIKRGDKAFGVKFKDMDGNDAEGVFWADGPDANTAWITTKDPETGKNKFKLVAKGTGGKGVAREIKNLDTITEKIPTDAEAAKARETLKNDEEWLKHEKLLKEAEEIRAGFKSKAGTQWQRDQYDRAVERAEAAKPSTGEKLSSDKRGELNRVIGLKAMAEGSRGKPNMPANASTNAKNFMADREMTDDDTADMPSLFDEPEETPKPKPKAEAPKPKTKAEAPKPEPKAAESKPDPKPEPKPEPKATKESEKSAPRRGGGKDVVETREVDGVEERVRENGTIERGDYLIIPPAGDDKRYRIMENSGSYRLAKAQFANEAAARKRVDLLTSQEKTRKERQESERKALLERDARKAGTKADAPKADADLDGNLDDMSVEDLAALNRRIGDRINSVDEDSPEFKRLLDRSDDLRSTMMKKLKAEREVKATEDAKFSEKPTTHRGYAEQVLSAGDLSKLSHTQLSDLNKNRPSGTLSDTNDKDAVSASKAAGFAVTSEIARRKPDQGYGTRREAIEAQVKRNEGDRERHLEEARKALGGSDKTDAPGADAPETPSDPWDADITIEHTPDGGTIVHGTEKGSPAIQVLKDNGFRWSRNLGSWYQPRTRDQRPNQRKIDRTAEALEKAGFSVGKAIDNDRRSAADREAAKAQRADERAEALSNKADRRARDAEVAEAKHRAASDALPWGGEPIKVGHHSEGRHRRAIEKSFNALGKSVEADREAKRAADRADTAARATDRRNNPVTVGNRIETIRADIARLEKRNLSDSGKDRLADLKDDLAYWSDVRAQQIKDGVVPDASPETIKAGDLVSVKNHGMAKVTKVNKTSLDVVVDEKTGRSLRYKFHEVTKHKPVEGGEPEKPADFSMAPHRANTRITKANLADGEKTVRNGMERKGFTVHKDYTVTDSDGNRHLRYLGSRPGTLDGARAVVDRMAVDRETLGRNSSLMGQDDAAIKRMLDTGRLPDDVTRSDAEKVLKGREGFTPDENKPREVKPKAAKPAPRSADTTEAPGTTGANDTPPAQPERPEAPKVDVDNFTMASPEEQGEDLMSQYAVKYRDDDGEWAEGTFWSPGPTDRTAWITQDTPSGEREFILVDRDPRGSGLRKVRGDSHQVMANNAKGNTAPGSRGDKARTNFMDKFVSRGTEKQRKAVAEAKATQAAPPATSKAAGIEQDPRARVDHDGKSFMRMSMTRPESTDVGNLVKTPGGWGTLRSVDRSYGNGNRDISVDLVDGGEWKGKVTTNLPTRRKDVIYNRATSQDQHVTAEQARMIEEVNKDRLGADGIYDEFREMQANARVQSILEGKGDPGKTDRTAEVGRLVDRVRSTTSDVEAGRALGGDVRTVAEWNAADDLTAYSRVELPTGEVLSRGSASGRGISGNGVYHQVVRNPEKPLYLDRASKSLSGRQTGGQIIEVRGEDAVEIRPRSVRVTGTDVATGKTVTFSMKKDGHQANTLTPIQYTSGPRKGEAMSRADIERVDETDRMVWRAGEANLDPDEAEVLRSHLQSERKRVLDEVNANPSGPTQRVTTDTPETPAGPATTPSGGAYVPDMSGLSAEKRAEIEKHIARADAIKSASEALSAIPDTPERYYERRKLIDDLNAAKRLDDANTFTLGVHDGTPEGKKAKADLARINRERKVPNPSTKLGKKPTTLTDDMVNFASAEDIGAHAKDVREEWAKRLTPEQRDERIREIVGNRVMTSTKVGDQTPRRNLERLRDSLMKVRAEANSPKREPHEVSDREVLDMLVGEHLSTTEVAQYLGIPKKDAYKALNRLRSGGYLDSMENGDTEQETYGQLVRREDGSLSKPVSGDRSRVEDLWWTAGFDDDGGATDRLNRWDKQEAAADRQRMARAKDRAEGTTAPSMNLPKNPTPANTTGSPTPRVPEASAERRADFDAALDRVAPRAEKSTGGADGVVPADSLNVGQKIAYPDHGTVEIIGERETVNDRFGRPTTRYMARGDDGREGYILYGEGAQVFLADDEPTVPKPEPSGSAPGTQRTQSAPSSGLTDADGDPVDVGSEGFRLGQGYQQWRVSKVNDDGTVDLEPMGEGKRNRIGVNPSRLKKHGASAPANRAAEATPTLTSPSDAGLYTVGRGGKKWRIASVNTDGTVNLVGESGEGRQRWSVDRSKLRETSNAAPVGAATGGSLGTDALGNEVSRDKTYRLGRGSQVWTVDKVNADGSLDLAPVGGDRSRKRLSVDPARLKATDAPAPKRGRPRKDAATARQRLDAVKARAETRQAETDAKAAKANKAAERVLKPDTGGDDGSNVLTDRVFNALSGVHTRRISALEGKSNLSDDERAELNMHRSALNKLRAERGLPEIRQ